MNFNFRHRRPDDPDPAVFFGYLDTYSVDVDLTVGGRVLEVQIVVDLCGSYDGTTLLPQNPVEVIGKNGGRRLVNIPLCKVSARQLKMSGFTALLTDAVNEYLLKHWGDIEAWAIEERL